MFIDSAEIPKMANGGGGPRKRASMFDDVSFSFAPSAAAPPVVSTDSDSDNSGNPLDEIRNQVVMRGAGGRGRGRGRGRGAGRASAVLAAAAAEHVISDDEMFDELSARREETREARKRSLRAKRKGGKNSVSKTPAKRAKVESAAAVASDAAQEAPVGGGAADGDSSSSLSSSSSSSSDEEVEMLSTSESEGSREPSPEPQFSKVLLAETARADVKKSKAVQAADLAIRRAARASALVATDDDAEDGDSRNPDDQIELSVRPLIQGAKPLKMRALLKTPFSAVVGQVAARLGCTPEELRMEWKNRTLAHDETPLGVRMQQQDAQITISLAPLAKSPPRTASASASSAEGVLALKVRRNDGNAIVIKIRKTSKLELLMQHYRDKASLGDKTLRFSFDGCALNPEDTPDSAGIEDEDIIEVDVE